MTEDDLTLEEEQTAYAARRHVNGDAEGLEALCKELNIKINSFLQEDIVDDRLRGVQHRCRLSLEIIREALQKYSLSSLSFSYNGGKDCLVLLILYLAQLSGHPDLSTSVSSIYIPHKHPFPLVDSFVDSSSNHYHLALTRQNVPQDIAKGGMKEAFASYLASPSGSCVRAIFVGTRRTDPHGADLTTFDPTDGGWPPFMRVHPILEWRYAEVWAFLRHLDIKYCSLYDKGYTSLGGVDDTHPNPMLRCKNNSLSTEYRPAYELLEDDEERLGRE